MDREVVSLPLASYAKQEPGAIPGLGRTFRVRRIRTDSPMILTNNRFRRRPSRLPGQSFRLALKDPLPGVKVQAAVDHRDHNLAPDHLPLSSSLMNTLAAMCIAHAPSGADSHLS